ncbi:prolipoprotein diacylglyceryl transferase [Neolewinella lacunae]|uniref:Phosphatidylglycerol--prolipoprotein diacylglyceryl transferase n=1 Tax=Neolewinella lacunae TaxID=1517758 RepID=A0A923PTC9_9BACT|nr:prolipoprotein diacylglyceryl transferase [Neolewinella lacunae]MBC6996457.1 prolipoprotein diacylglyceryl transferase [Neolewinella lacunae]MDN3633600.1 prolipoprotein diacylglyceryl transferase [Neolewinella lacunae]
MLAYITWTASPEIFSIGPIHVRWYGLMFAFGFMIGFWLVRRMFLAEKAPEAWLDYLFYFLIGGTVLGARLGHVLFYEWEYYSTHPSEIIKIWEGGLASHGGVIGVVTALWLFSRFVSKKSFFWVSDKVAAPIALVGAMIRFGNLMNSEIVGTPSDRPWAFKFVNATPAELAAVPRHPVQLYELLSYLLVFGVLLWLYWQRDAWKKPGLLTGLWFIGIFGFRFLWEYFKSDQGGFGQALTTGQWLSVPCVLAGLVMVLVARAKDV